MKEKTPVTLTEIERPGNIPALYIYCDLANFDPGINKQEFLNRVRRMFDRHFPDHYLMVGDVDLKFAYIEGQKAMYHELKEDHLSR